MLNEEVWKRLVMIVVDVEIVVAPVSVVVLMLSLRVWTIHFFVAVVV